MTEAVTAPTVETKSRLRPSRFQDPLLITVPTIGPISIFV
jgi:hypothetical protein